MPCDAPELARRLARDAEAVCRHYLSKGRRQGRYWTVGDVRNTPGRSMFVRLSGPDSGLGAAGRWTDAASTEHGDLLDVIRESCGLVEFREVAEEARRFLSLPRAEATAAPRPPAPQGSPEAARRLWAMAKPLAGTIAETYLRARGIAATPDMTALRFHPCCWYRPEADSPNDARDTWPALIAAVTDKDGAVTGVQRTWLDPSGGAKAPVAVPRRAMGHLLGHAVRFGTAGDVMAAGEGIETVLSLRLVMPTLPMAAALSAAHLAAIHFPPGLRRLYIVHDNDPAGRRAGEVLTKRAQAGGIEALTLAPALGDFNDDLRQLGTNALAASVRAQSAPEDVTRIWLPAPRDARIRSARSGSRSEVLSSWHAPGWESRTLGLPRGRSERKPTGPATVREGYFPPAPGHPHASARGPPSRRLCIAKQNSPPAPSSALLRPLGLKPGGASPLRPRSSSPAKAAMGAASRRQPY